VTALDQLLTHSIIAWRSFQEVGVEEGFPPRLALLLVYRISLVTTCSFHCVRRHHRMHLSPPHASVTTAGLGGVGDGCKPDVAGERQCCDNLGSHTVSPHTHLRVTSQIGRPGAPAASPTKVYATVWWYEGALHP